MSGVDEFEDLETWNKPEDKTFDNWMDSRIARFETRTYDWDALKFQAQNTSHFRPWCCHLDVRGHLTYT